MFCLVVVGRSFIDHYMSQVDSIIFPEADLRIDERRERIFLNENTLTKYKTDDSERYLF